MPTLEQPPELHSVHCLVDVASSSFTSSFTSPLGTHASSIVSSTTYWLVINNEAVGWCGSTTSHGYSVFGTDDRLEYYNCSKCVEDDGSIPGSDPTKNECGLFARNKTKGIYISGRRRHHHQARKVTKNLQSNWEMTWWNRWWCARILDWLTDSYYWQIRLIHSLIHSFTPIRQPKLLPLPSSSSIMRQLLRILVNDQHNKCSGYIYTLMTTDDEQSELYYLLPRLQLIDSFIDSFMESCSMLTDIGLSFVNQRWWDLLSLRRSLVGPPFALPGQL